MSRTKVVALVPAYNEAENIELTVHSLMDQTYPFEKVIVIANNCTDETIPIVKRLISEYKKMGRKQLQLLIMKKNAGKKSGALNYGLTKVDKKIKYVFGMDGDTIVDKKMVEEAVLHFRTEKETAGICSAYRTLPLKENASRWEKFLWRMQNIEFTLANAWRIENYKSARVLPGVSVMFRMQALLEVAALQAILTNLQNKARKQLKKDGNKPYTRKMEKELRIEAVEQLLALKSKKGALRKFVNQQKKLKVWSTDSLVEDYRLTLDLKDIGWQVKSSMNMVSWSDVPLKLRGKGGLWDQRKRWYSGTIDEIRIRRFQKNSRYEIFTICLLVFNLFITFMLISAYTILFLEVSKVKWVSFFLILPILAALTQLHRIKGGDQLDNWQRFITGTLIANELYAMYREVIYAYSIWISIFKPDREW